VQYDYKNDVTRDALVGVDYDSCCWSVALYGRSFYNNFDVISTTKPHTGVMLQITFKGLTGNSDSSLSSLLKQKIYGFTQVDSSWQNR
jgi:LPS-assembly protein